MPLVRRFSKVRFHVSQGVLPPGILWTRRQDSPWGEGAPRVESHHRASALSPRLSFTPACLCRHCLFPEAGLPYLRTGASCFTAPIGAEEPECEESRCLGTPNVTGIMAAGLASLTTARPSPIRTWEEPATVKCGEEEETLQEVCWGEWG